MKVKVLIGNSSVLFHMGLIWWRDLITCEIDGPFVVSGFTGLVKSIVGNDNITVLW